MPDLGGMIGGTTAAIVISLLIILAIAWILLPFAMFGMKPLLRELIAETKATNRLLEAASRPRDGRSADHFIR